MSNDSSTREEVLNSADTGSALPLALDIVEAGFFRDRTAFAWLPVGC